MTTHWALAAGGDARLAAGIAALQVTVAGAVLLGGRVRGGGWLAVLAGALFLAAAQFAPADGIQLESGLAHAGLYGGLLLLFARTLRPGREALVTAMARRVHARRGEASLRPEIAAYTRRVTQAWCVFFASQLAGSLLLFAFAPLGAWSLFVNVLDLPLVLAMFVAEYAWRSVRFRGTGHPSLAETVRSFLHRDADPLPRAAG